MSAIYHKEVKGFLSSMIGYVCIAFLLAVTGIYFTAYHLQAAYPRFSFTLQGILFVFLIAVPVLTMRVLAEERHQKTDQLLLTSPVSITGIVLGKYLALVTIFLIPIIIIALYPLILMQFGTVSLPMAYTSLAGFFLLGCCFLAIGMYLSSVTESQVIAAVLTFLVLFVCYVIPGISSFFPETASASFYILLIAAVVLTLPVYCMTHYTLSTLLFGLMAGLLLTVFYITVPSLYEGLVQKLLYAFDISSHFSEFAAGVLDVTGIVYYLSMIGVCLFLTVQSIQKRRWS
ncbi:MAG: ABC transporter permease subunit [Lachnospiraceae bacterium]|nr:ABC transporter permease subunit [Lachnospiraceae bacterium]